MSSTTNSVSAMLTYIQKSAAATNVSSVTEIKVSGTATNSFSNILNKTSDTLVQTKDISSGNQKDITKRADQQVQSNKAEKAINGVSKPTDDRIKDNLTSSKEDYERPIKANTDDNSTNSMEADEKLQEAIGETKKELISKIAKALEVDEANVLSAMQTLGLMAGDLFNPEDLQSLVNDIIGDGKVLDLLTDSDLYTVVQDLYEGVDSIKSELSNEFNLSDEELQKAFELTDEDYSNILKQAANVKADNRELKNPEIVVDEAGDELSKDLKTPQSKEQIPEIRVEAKSEEIKTSEFKPVEEMDSSSKNQKESERGLNDNSQNTNLFNQLLNNITEAANASPVSNISYTDRAQMENIIRQITEKITISAGESETSMELQLHPAHLGNVNILLTSTKDGIVAKFTAQNEIVKEAVESQMIQLQQKFDEQGVKVTAIEVTIASHAFEQSLQQDDKNQNFEQENGKPKRPLRRLNLSEVLDGEGEELSDADIVAAKVMEMNGNSVDYSA